MKRAIGILLIACSAMSFTLIFTQWHGVVASAFLGIVGLVLLVSSLKFLSAKSDYREPAMPSAMRTGKLVILTSLSSLIAVLQTLAMREYRSQVLGLLVTALCWIWAFRNIAQLFGFTRRVTRTDDSSV